MRANFTNLPTDPNKNQTIKEFEGYQNIRPSTDPNVYSAMVGFFSSKGFETVAAELITETIMTQAKSDGYSAMQILDSMRSLNEIELSAIVAEILNFNRYKSSSLGFYPQSNSNPEILRNIIA